MVSFTFMPTEGGWVVIFHPHALADDEDCMILHVFKDMKLAERYAHNFNETLSSAFAHYDAEKR